MYGNRRRVPTFVLLLSAIPLILSSITPAEASDTIAVSEAWTRATPPGAKVAAGFLTIKNNGTEPITLKSASTEIAERVEIHSMTMKDGMMEMRALTDGLKINPGESVTLKPGGLHLMFLQLKDTPKVGGSVSGTLNFKDIGNINVNYVVQKLGTKTYEPKPAN